MKMKDLIFEEKSRKFSYQAAKGNRNEITVCVVDYLLCMDSNNFPHSGLYDDVHGTYFVPKNQKYHKFFQFIKSCKDKKIEVVDNQSIVFRAIGITERHEGDVYDKVVGQDVALEQDNKAGLRLCERLVAISSRMDNTCCPRW